MSRAQGRAVEEEALHFLQGRGLALLVRNWYCRMGELDLVMQDGDTVVIVEVRQRRNRAYASALESVTPAKQQRLVRTARLFLQYHPALADSPVRFDVLAYGPGHEPEHWVRNAFEASH